MMDKVDYEHLEILLAKLSKDIGHNRFCIIPSYIQDGCYIGIYKEDGNIDKQVAGINIEDAMRMLQCST